MFREEILATSLDGVDASRFGNGCFLEENGFWILGTAARRSVNIPIRCGPNSGGSYLTQHHLRPATAPVTQPKILSTRFGQTLPNPKHSPPAPGRGYATQNTLHPLPADATQPKNTLDKNSFLCFYQSFLLNHPDRIKMEQFQDKPRLNIRRDLKSRPSFDDNL